jgi:hypothetical protein
VAYEYLRSAPIADGQTAAVSAVSGACTFVTPSSQAVDMQSGSSGKAAVEADAAGAVDQGCSVSGYLSAFCSI